MKKKYLLLFIFFICWNITSAQFRPKLPDFYKEKATIIKTLSDSIFKIPDSTQALAYIEGFRKWAKENNDLQMVLEAELIRAYYYQNNFAHQDPKYLKYTASVLQKAKMKGILFVQIRAAKTMAIYYWQHKKPTKPKPSSAGY